MGKDKLSTAVIEQITAIASRVGAESAMEKIKAERRRGSKELTRTTKKQLESYRTIKKTLLEETHFTQEEEAEIRWRFLEDFMSAMPYTNREVDSVVGEKERKRQETMYCLHEIETALRIYKEECEASGNEERKARSDRSMSVLTSGATDPDTRLLQRPRRLIMTNCSAYGPSAGWATTSTRISWQRCLSCLSNASSYFTAS